jgi:hypothetical protein
LRGASSGSSRVTRECPLGNPKDDCYRLKRQELQKHDHRPRQWQAQLGAIANRNFIQRHLLPLLSDDEVAKQPGETRVALGDPA